MITEKTKTNGVVSEIIPKGPKIYEGKKYNDTREAFRDSLERNNDHLAFKLKDKIQSEGKYEEIRMSQYMREINVVGASLLKLGKKDKKIGIYSENSYDWVLAHASIIFGLGVAVPMDAGLPKEEVSKIIKRAELDTIFTSTSKAETLLESKKEEGFDFDIILLDRYTTKKEESIREKLLKKYPKIISMRNLIKENENDVEQITKYKELEIDPDAMVELTFTSATTSNSKAVMTSHKNVCTVIYDISCVYDIKPGDVILTVLPLHHTFEGTTGYKYFVVAGGTITFMDGLRHIADNMKEYGVTVMIAVPALFEAIHKGLIKQIKKMGKYKRYKKAISVSNALLKFGIDQRKRIFKSVLEGLGGRLRLLVIGGAPLAAEVQKGYNNLGINTYQGYGLTETSPVIITSYDKYTKPGSIGRALSSADVRIADIDETGIGEIQVKGDMVMLGYYNDEEKNKEAFTNDGFLKTGDLGYYDEEGYIYIAGRKKSVIILNNGKNIFPEETEELINKMDGVEESMVFAREEKTGGEKKLEAKIVYNEKYFEGKSEKEIYNDLWNEVKKLNKKQPVYKYIKEIHLTKEPLIKTTTMKIKRYKEMKKIEEEFPEK